jgi:hypothetical protein
MITHRSGGNLSSMPSRSHVERWVSGTCAPPGWLYSASRLLYSSAKLAMQSRQAGCTAAAQRSCQENLTCADSVPVSMC